ncbi:4'-phosphopantetheinyl transferase [Streptomyces cyaneofuscatus]|uniref:4'-phosphopantetheinyl transferase n=1 Tax=Streptomyces cyaneofuscatus TaxID=66883 RepID=UPI0037B583BA
MSATLLSPLLPRSTQVFEEFGDPSEAFLFPDEQVTIAKAVDKRRREFATTRHCARRALAALGQPAVPLVPGQRGAPTWPAGVVGSMTHCDGYCAAAVAIKTDVASLGIDAEPHAALPDGILDLIALPREAQQVAELARQNPRLHWDRLLFSAKESVYKTWFPITGQWLGFHEAELEIDPYGKTFQVRILREAYDQQGRPLQAFSGRWQVLRDLALTAVAYQM